VRLLERITRGRSPVGLFANPRDEVARFGAHNTLIFPASAIQSLAWREQGPPLMIVNFMGLTGRWASSRSITPNWSANASARTTGR